MYISYSSRSYENIIDCLSLQERIDNKEDLDIEFELRDIKEIKRKIEIKIEGLLGSEDFIFKEKGFLFSFNNKDYYLNTKSFNIDKEITTLNSLLKICNFCITHKIPLVFENCKKELARSNK